MPEPRSRPGSAAPAPRKKSDGTLFAKGEQLCDSCANADGCPLRDGATRLIRLCEEYDSSADILGPIPSLAELET